MPLEHGVLEPGFWILLASHLLHQHTSPSREGGAARQEL